MDTQDTYTKQILEKVGNLPSEKVIEVLGFRYIY